MAESEMFAEITWNKKETAELHLLRLTKPSGFHHLPGQYIEVSILESNHSSFFAVASHPSEPFIELLIKPSGENAKKICHMPTGSEIRISEPLGPGFPINSFQNKTIYLITHGTGISAIKPVIEELRKERNKYGPIRLIYGVRYPDDIPFKNLLREWMGSLEIYDIVSDDPGNLQVWSGETGHVQDVLMKIQPNPDNSVALVTGSEKMEHQILEMLKEFGFEPDSIFRNH